MKAISIIARFGNARKNDITSHRQRHPMHRTLRVAIRIAPIALLLLPLLAQAAVAIAMQDKGDPFASFQLVLEGDHVCNMSC